MIVIYIKLAPKESDIITKIIKDPIVFPKNIIVSETVYKILSGLLDKNSKSRIDTNDPLFETWYCEDSPDFPIIKSIEEPIEIPKITTQSSKDIQRKSKTIQKSVSKNKIISKYK